MSVWYTGEDLIPAMDGNKTDNKDPTRFIWLEAIPPTLYPYQPDNKDPTRFIWLEAIPPTLYPYQPDNKDPTGFICLELTPTLYPYQPDNKDSTRFIWLEATPTLYTYQPDRELEAIFQPCSNFILVSIAGKHMPWLKSVLDPIYWWSKVKRHLLTHVWRKTNNILHHYHHLLSSIYFWKIISIFFDMLICQLLYRIPPFNLKERICVKRVHQRTFDMLKENWHHNINKYNFNLIHYSVIWTSFIYHF
jgi:hypothetical protein